MTAKKKQVQKKRKYVRKETKVHPKAVICYCPQVCPDVMQVQLRYAVPKNASGGGIGAISDFVFRGNSPFDPDFVIGGQQPMGYDQWSNFYRRYRVLASKVIVMANANSNEPSGVGIVANNTSSAFISREQAREQQYGKSIVLGSRDGSQSGTLTQYVSTAQVRGGPSDIVQYEQDLSALVTANPDQQFFWHIYGWGTGLVPNSFDVSMQIEIVYYIQFYDRETLVRS